MWNFQNNLEAFNIVDLKPPNIEELAEVITHVEYHPKNSNIFLFSSSKGYICTCDLRMNSQFDKCSTMYMVEDDPSRKHFFTDIISSISRAKFASQYENLIYSRDYLAAHIWDIRKTKSPVKSFYVTDYLDKKLCEVYESEMIFDKFDLQVSPNSRILVTGSYNANIHLIDVETQTNVTIDVKFMDKRGKSVGDLRYYKGKRVVGSLKNAYGDSIINDMSQKITLGTFHPTENIFAVARSNSLYVYSEKRNTDSNSETKNLEND